MSIRNKGLSLIAIAAAGLIAGVYWPSKIEETFHGWVEKTASLRSVLPGAAPVPGKSEAGAAPNGASAQRSNMVASRPPVPVNIDTVQRGAMPVRLDAVGIVQPVASVALRTRIDAQIDKIFVDDGAMVKTGEVLVKLDSRQIEAQIKQTEATLAKDEAALEQAMRDAARTADLLTRGAGTQLNVDNAKTLAASSRAVLAADQALLDNQKVQLTWYTLIAPITGRVGTFSAKVGNIVRSGDNTSTGVIANIVQTSPIYVAFSIPQTALADVRDAIAAGRSEVRATPQGAKRSAVGKIAVLDNTIDAATGTIMIRAIFENADDVLWAGQLCNVRVTLRVDPDVVSIPRTATQSGQQGNFVFLIENGVARSRKVSVGRFQDGRDVILEGLSGGETVVSDGALLLIDGSRVEIRKDSIEKKGAI
jgi:RND family efflux transporter MFP subunit